MGLGGVGQTPARVRRAGCPFPSPTEAAVSRVHAWALGRGVPWVCRDGLLLGGAAVPHGLAPSPQAPILWAVEGCGLGSWGAGVLSKQLEPGWVFSTAQLPSRPCLGPRRLSGSETQKEQTQAQRRPCGRNLYPGPFPLTVPNSRAFFTFSTFV